MVHPILSRADPADCFQRQQQITSGFCLGLCDARPRPVQPSRRRAPGVDPTAASRFIQARALSDIAPKSAIEWLLAVDVVKLSWEIDPDAGPRAAIAVLMPERSTRLIRIRRTARQQSLRDAKRFRRNA